MSHRAKLVVAGVVVIAAVLAGTGTAAEPNDRTLVLNERAGAYHYLASTTRDCCTAYSDAVAAFGSPTHFRRNSNTCLVTWRNHGIKIVFAGIRGACTEGSLRKASWYGLRLFGRGWHDDHGLRIGKPLAKVKALYPKATWERKGAPGKEPWLVLQRRVVNGLHFVALAGRFNRRGQLAAIHVPAAYIY